MFQKAIINMKNDYKTSLSNIITVYFSLTIFGCFALVYLNVVHIMGHLFEFNHHSILLASDTPKKERKNIMHQLTIVQGVSNIQWVSPQEAKQELLQSFKDKKKIFSHLNLRPFPWILEFKLIKESFVDDTDLSLLLKNQYVTSYISGRETNQQIQNFFRVVQYIGWMFLIFLSISIVIITNTAIQVSLYHQIEEIQLLHSLGASPNFIRFPYIVEGILVATFSYIFAVASVFLIYKTIVASITFNKATYIITQYAHFFYWKDIVFSFIVIIILTIFGAWISTRKIFHAIY